MARASKTVTVEIHETLGLSETLRIRGKNKQKKEILKHRVDGDGTQHRIEVDRSKDTPEVHHSVWKNGKRIHHHNKTNDQSKKG